MQQVFIKDDFIKLGQALKLAGFIDSGVEAKVVINEGLVQVNNETVLMRGKKLVNNDVVSYKGNSFQIVTGDM